MAKFGVEDIHACDYLALNFISLVTYLQKYDNDSILRWSNSTDAGDIFSAR